MAVPVVPILKKAATVLVGDKKGRKVLLTVIGMVLVIAMLPVLILQGILTIPFDLLADEIEPSVEEEQMERVAALLAEKGCSTEQTEKAQTLYVFVLYDHASDDGFAEKLANCFTPNQQNAELITVVNGAFGTTLPQDFFEQITGGSA